MVIKINGGTTLIQLIGYVAMGMLYTVLVHGNIDWNDAWSYIHIGLWPYFFLFLFFKWVFFGALVIGAICGAGVLAMWLGDRIKEARR